LIISIPYALDRSSNDASETNKKERKKKEKNESEKKQETGEKARQHILCIA